MLISLLIFLLISNAVTIRRDKSILFFRIVIKSLLSISNAVTIRRDKSILFFRIVIKSLLSISNAVTIKRDKSILFFRIVIKSLLSISNTVVIWRDRSILFFRIVIKCLLLIRRNKSILFFKSVYTFITYNNLYLVPLTKGIADNYIDNENKHSNNTLIFNREDIKINSSLSVTISILTFLLILFIFMPTEWFNIVSIFAFIMVYYDK